MAGPGTTFTGPVMSGTKWNPDGSGAANTGIAALTQQVSLTQNSTTAVSATMVVPANAQLLSFFIDVTTAFDSASSATLTIGTSAAGTQYVGSINAKTGGRAAPTYSAAQLTAMLNVGSSTSVVVTITPSGATTAGAATVTMLYIQALAPTVGYA